ncbi:unnamed protein product [Blepharisma stoltei]|uniref:Uncharacterized protein n=1 Tax=Blepharisma stoltei TaxID=1481888 RepID=A0AAU9JAB7_9CILI|nr:unnamed protein product [Blepharisma stoltei]
MRLLILIVSVCFAEFTDTLTKENQNLLESNRYLHSQLIQLAQKVNFTTQIQDDYFYNKQMMLSLIGEYEMEADEIVRTAIAEQMLVYTQGLFEDANLLGGHIEGVSSKELIEIHHFLKTSIENIKKIQRAQKFGTVYNELKSIVLEKDINVRDLQTENAQINAEIQKKNGELEEVKSLYSHNKQRIGLLREELEMTKKDHEDWLNSLKSISQSEQQQSRAKERKKFKLYQELQDKIISSLQTKIAEQSIKIQELSSEKAAMTSRSRLLSNTVDRLHSDLELKSSQLQSAQLKFDEFREQVSLDSDIEIASIEENERQVKSQLRELKSKHTELLVTLTSLQKEKESTVFLIGQFDNYISELELEVAESANREDLAVKFRDLEIKQEENKVQDSFLIRDEVGKELQILLQKIDSEAKSIQEIQDKLHAFGYREEAPSKTVTTFSKKFLFSD